MQNVPKAASSKDRRHCQPEPMPDHLPERQPNKESAQDCATNKVRLHGQNAQRYAHHDPGQPLALPCIHVAEDAIDPDHQEEGNVNIIADIAAVKK